MLLSHDAFGGGCEHDERFQQTPGFQARARASKSDRGETRGWFYSTPAIDCRCALTRRSSRFDVKLPKTIRNVEIHTAHALDVTPRRRRLRRRRRFEMGKLLKKYSYGRGLPTNSAHTAATFEAEREKKRALAQGRRPNPALVDSTTASSSPSARAGKPQKQWKSRGGAKPRLMRALRVSAHGHRALTEKEVEKLIKPVIDPKRAKFGGQGFARSSTFLNIAREDFLDAFTELFDEHIDGFNGKSYVKMGKAQEDMLWKQKLREKAAASVVGGRAMPPKDVATRREKKRKHMTDSPVSMTPKTKVDTDLQAQAIAAYRALKAKKQQHGHAGGGGAKARQR